MNPYAIIAALGVWFASAIGAYFYGHHEANLACDSKVQKVQEAWDKSVAAQNATAATQAGKAVSDTNAVTEANHEAVDKVDQRAATVRERIRVVAVAAAPTSCLRAPVDGAVDQLLRDPAAAGEKPADSAAH